MSTTLKCMIPFVTNKVKPHHLTKEAGFIDAYTHDADKPYLDNHIFLLFDSSNITAKKPYQRLKDLEYMKNAYTKTINGKLHYVYVISLSSNIFTSIAKMDKYFSPTTDMKIKILNYWKGADDDVNRAMITNSLIKYERLEMPLEDKPNFVLSELLD